MNLGKQINKGHKCPNCKKFGLKLYYTVSPDYGLTIGEVKGICRYTKKAKQRYRIKEFYRCRNCFAEYEALEK